jgi:hypothetical protein
MTDKIRNTLLMLKSKHICFWIGGGYCLRRIRPFHDIDVSVYSGDWPLLIETLPGGRERAFGPLGEPKRYVTHYVVRLPEEKSIDFWKGSVVSGFEYGGNRVGVHLVNGLWEWTEETALNFKKETAALGVEKDVKFLHSIGQL